MKKKKIIFGILIICICIGGGLGMYAIRTRLQKQDDEALMEKVAPEIEEFYQWNYSGVKRTKPIKVYINPASKEKIIGYEVILENERRIKFDAVYSKNQIILTPLNSTGSPEVKFKVPETSNVNTADKYLLQPSDIETLKKKGFRATISGEQIKKYLKRD